jgi:hypothetical protein
MSRKSRVKARKAAQSQQGKQQQTILIVGVVVVFISFLAIVAWRARTAPGANLDLDAIPDNSVAYESLGREHINLGDEHIPYNSNPPTSGPHASPLRTRVYTSDMPDENLIHNLEHGHIWLSYRDSDDEETLSLFRQFQSQFTSSVIVTHRPANDSRIAVAAWTRLLKLDDPDEEQILAFIRRYLDKAPESIPGN